MFKMAFACKKSKTILFGGLFFALCFLSLQVKAFELSITPPSFNLTLAPGSTYTDYVQINGSRDQSTRIKSYMQDWYLKTNGDMVYLKPGSLKRSMVNWISYEPSNFIIPPDSKQKVKFTIKVPSDVQGGYWGMIFFETIQPRPTGGTSISISGRVGVTFHVATINIVKKAQLGQLELEWRPGNKTLLGTVKFENQGNILLHYKGRLEIRDLNNNVVAKTEISEAGVLPDSFRMIPVTWHGTLSKQKYIVLVIIDYGGEKLIASQAVLTI